MSNEKFWTTYYTIKLVSIIISIDGLKYLIDFIILLLIADCNKSGLTVVKS